MSETGEAGVPKEPSIPDLVEKSFNRYMSTKMSDKFQQPFMIIEATEAVVDEVEDKKRLALHLLKDVQADYEEIFPGNGFDQSPNEADSWEGFYSILSSRLLHSELVRAHPEILEEGIRRSLDFGSMNQEQAEEALKELHEKQKISPK